MKTSKGPLAIFCALAFSENVFAEKIESKFENKFDLGLNASSQYTDNALKSSSDIFSERQDILGAVVDAAYLNDWGQFDAQYLADSYRFDKKSQADHNLSSGGASLVLGASTDPLSIAFTHSRSIMLRSPDLVDLVQNEEERNMVSVNPSARLRLGAGDQLALNGSFSTANYRYEPNKKSDAKGAGLVWQRLISGASNLEVTARQDEMTFEKVHTNDFTLQNINAKYAVKLNHFEYSVTAGGNNIPAKDEAPSFFRPLYNFQTSYVDGFNTFKISVDQKIINGAMGNVNDLALGSSAVSTGENGIGFINSRTYQALWVTKDVCEKCELKTDLYQTQKEFRIVSENQKDIGIRVSFSYNYSKSLNIYASSDDSKRDFSALSTSRSFKLTQYEIGLNYKIYNDLMLRLYSKKEHRDSVDVRQGFYEHIDGLSLNYMFKK